MNSSSASIPERELVELAAARNVGAVSEVYDRHAPMVHEYCAGLCPPELVPEATMATFVDFLARAQSGRAEEGADQLLQRAARTAAAARLRADGHQSPACGAVPELLAARANGELPRDDEALQAHLADCSTCRRVAAALENAEGAFQRDAHHGPPAKLREEWIELASAKRPSSPEPKTVTERERPSSVNDAPDAAPPMPQARVRARRGGLVAAARRAVASRRR